MCLQLCDQSCCTRCLLPGGWPAAKSGNGAHSHAHDEGLALYAVGSGAAGGWQQGCNGCPANCYLLWWTGLGGTRPVAQISLGLPYT